MGFSPLDILNEARRAVPVVDYALGVAGVAVACNLVIEFLGHGQATFLVIGAMLAGMLLLMLLGRLLKTESIAINVAAITVTWAVVMFFIAFLGFTTTAAAFYWPKPWAEFLGLSQKHAPLYYEATPSFSCILNRNEDEQTICHNEALAKMDVQLDARFQQLRNKLPADKFKPIHDAQVVWLASRKNCGNSSDCIKNLYQQRLAQLDAALRGS